MRETNTSQSNTFELMQRLWVRLDHKQRETYREWILTRCCTLRKRGQVDRRQARRNLVVV